MNKGSLRGFPPGGHLERPLPTDENKFLRATSYQTDGLDVWDESVPLQSIQSSSGGVWIGKRALDKWRYTLEKNRRVVVLGDSLAQGLPGPFDSWAERLSRDLGNWCGPRLTAGAGFYGLYRSGNQLGYNNGDREWRVAGTWTKLAATSTAMLAPYGQAYQTTGAATVASAATGTTTAASPVISVGTAFFTTAMIGGLISGTGLARNTWVCPLTTVLAASNGVDVTTFAGAGTLNVGTTTGEAASGTIKVVTSTGEATITYTGVGATTYTGCTTTAGTGTLSTFGGVVNVLRARIAQNAISASTTSTFTAHPNLLVWTAPMGRYATRSAPDCVYTVGSAALYCPSANFKSTDVGSLVLGVGLGATTLYYISAVTDISNATLNTGTNVVAAVGTVMLSEGRVVTDLATTNTSKVITSATANFTSFDLHTRIVGAGIPNASFIQSIESPTSATISIAATATASGVAAHIAATDQARTDWGVTTSSTTLTAVKAALTLDDIGKRVTGTGVADNTFITAVASATSATLSAAVTNATTSGQLTISATGVMDVQHIEIMDVHGVASNGNWSYSTSGGTTFTAVTNSTATPPILFQTAVTVANPTTVILRGTTTGGAAAQCQQCGIFTYTTAPSATQVKIRNTPGLCLYNVAMDGNSYFNLIQGGVGDPMAFFDFEDDNATPALGWRGLRPDLLICLFSNDPIWFPADLRKFRNNLMRLVSRCQGYADIILVNPAERSDLDPGLQARFRAVLKEVALSTATPTWFVDDGTTASNTTVTSATMAFQKDDLGKAIQGGSIPAGATITAVASATSVTISAAASSTASNVPLTITGNRIDTACAVLDLYDAYAAGGAVGYAACYADGLMFDAAHQTQVGHNDNAARLSRMLRLFS